MKRLFYISKCNKNFQAALYLTDGNNGFEYYIEYYIKIYNFFGLLKLKMIHFVIAL